MDAFSFAITKVQPPRPRGSRVERALLQASLGHALQERRVVLLQAPAGFGKTSLMVSQLGRLPPGTAVAWVSLDAEDDARRLFACLVTALEPLDLPWRSSPEALAAAVDDDGPGRRRAAAELLNALAESGVPRGVIVLDDLHRLSQPGALALIEMLLERLPASWSLLLASRVEPPLPLARWRVAGELAEFFLDDLRFSQDEARALALAEGTPEAAEQVGPWFERTQGWPAGLRLCLATQRGRVGATPAAPRPAAADRLLFDYLAAEVLEEMPRPLHDFLVRSSVLPTLTAERAARVTGDARAPLHLEAIERRGLFVTALDPAGQTLVLHDLFRDALQDRLRRLWPQELPALLRRAAEDEPDPLRRVQYLLQAGDWVAAEATLQGSAPELFLQGAAGEVQRLVGQFPAEVLQASSGLLRLSGLAHCLRWHWTEMAERMAQAERVAAEAGALNEQHLALGYLSLACYPLGRNEESEACLHRLRGQPLAPHARSVALMAECTQAFRKGEHDRLPALYGELVQLLEQHLGLFHWWECSPAASWSTVRGMRPVLQRFISGALLRCGEQALPMRAEIQVQQAFATLWSGDVAGAEAQALAAEADMKWLACAVDTEISLRLFQMIVHAMRGRRQQVEQMLQALFIKEDANPDLQRRRLWQHQMAVYGVRLSDVLGGDAATLERWSPFLTERPLDAGGNTTTQRAIAVRARHAAAQGRWADAAELFCSLLPRAERMDVMGQALELQLRAAHALLQSSRLEEAAQVLEPALERIQQDGDRGHALMCGSAVLQRLAGADWRALLPRSLVDELQQSAAMAVRLREPVRVTPEGQGAQETPRPAPDGLLSAREQEVLACMARGDSNKHIARALEISPHTVKRHVANILDKLNLPSRAAAAAWLHRQAGTLQVPAPRG